MLFLIFRTLIHFERIEIKPLQKRNLLLLKEIESKDGGFNFIIKYTPSSWLKVKPYSKITTFTEIVKNIINIKVMLSTGAMAWSI